MPRPFMPTRVWRFFSKVKQQGARRRSYRERLAIPSLSVPIQDDVTQVRLAGEIAGEVIDQIARVIFRAVDEGRLASPQDRQSDRIQPRRLDNPAIMPQMAFGIDHRNIEPAVVQAKPGRPDDGLDFAAPEVEMEP